jgi:hypothetical protein
MTNISRKKTESPEFVSLQKELTRMLSKLDQRTAPYFFEELFTSTERIMIIKRFGSLLLFERGYSPYKVWNLLHISPTTAQKLYQRYEIGAYDKMLGVMTKEKMPELLVFIEKLIRAQGRDRWMLIK